MRFLLFAFCFLLLLTGCSPKVYTQLNPPEQAVTVDADISEFGVMRFYARDIQTTYSLTNDNENLYVCARIDDEETQRRVMHNGLVLFIDTTSKPTQQIAITYPVPGQRNFKKEDPTGQGGIEDRTEYKRMRQTFFLNHNTVRLFGFKNHFTGTYPLENRSGVKVKMDWDSLGSLVYEAKIPFKSFYRDKISPADTNHVFNLTLLLSNVVMPQGGGSPGGRGKLRNVGISVGGGMGMGMGGGFGSGMGVGVGVGGGGNGMQPAYGVKNAVSMPFRINYR